jgi:hypothetical protein
MAARPSRLKIALRMLGLGVALGWASVYLIPWLMHAGVTERTANRLPFVAFALGLAWGLLSAVSTTALGLLTFAVLVPLTGAVFWFFGVLLGGFLVGCGVSSDTADYVPVIVFCFGAGLASLPGLVLGSEAVQALFSRRSRRNQRKKTR